MPDTTYVCPNCGGDVSPTLDVFGEDGKVDPDLQVKPKGSVGVCQNCNMAVATTKENTAENLRSEPLPSDEAPSAERGAPGPDRVEDQAVILPEGALPSGSTSPEVALEDSIPEPESDATLADPADTTLATDDTNIDHTLTS